MTKDFIPQKIALLRAWLLNFFNALPGQAAAVHQTTTQVNATKAIAQTGMDKIDALVNAKAAQKAAVTDLHTWQKPGGTGLAVLRKNIDDIKGDPGYNSTIGGILRTVGIHEEFDAIDFKPTGEAIGQPGYILLNFVKHGVELMCLEFRLKGTTEFIHLGNVKDSGFHHVYTLPVVVPPVTPAVHSVVLEYRFTGVMHDVLIGHPSDLIVVTFEL